MFRYTHPNRERFDREGWPGDNIERLREQVEEQMRGSPGLSKWGEALLAVKCADPPVQHRAEDWPANLAAFRQVSDEMERFNTTRGHTDGEGNEISGRFADAMNAALLTPAPDFAALATKAAIYDAHEVDDGWHMAREITKLLAQDAARLAWQSGLAVFETATAALKDCREDEEIDAVADAQLEAIVSLLLTPAPDAAALSRKLEIVRAETAWGMNEGKAIMESFAEDLRRLTGQP